MVKRSVDQKLRAGVNVVLKEDQENAFNGKQKDSVREEVLVVSGTMKISVQNRHRKPNHLLSHQHKELEVRRQKRDLQRPESVWADQSTAVKGTCTELPCDYWHPPECPFCKSESGCKFGEKRSFAHRQVEGQLSKNRKKDSDKNTVALLKDLRQLGCVFRDRADRIFVVFMEEAKNFGTNSIGTIHKISAASCKHRKIQVKVPHQRSPYAF